MEEKLKAIIENNPHLTIETFRNIPVYVHGKTGATIDRYVVSGFPGFEGLELSISSEKDPARLEALINKKPLLFKDYIGGCFDGVVEILLERITFPARMSTLDNAMPIDINIAYNGNALQVRLEHSSEDTAVESLVRHLRHNNYMLLRKKSVLRICSLEKVSEQGIEADARNILISVLFDIEYTYELGYEVVSYGTARQRPRFKKRQQNDLPTKPIDLVFKNYIPELIEYFHIAEKVDYLPFKYICYFHIIEYFTDKSAYTAVARKVEELILRPDYHLKSKEYINQAINLFKKENEKFTGDKTKINRVLREYIDKDDLLKDLQELELEGHFVEPHTLECIKPLEIAAIKFENDKDFFDTLTKRIYSMRCSIVHSNPDFDESKAVPFSPTSKNMEFLRTEIHLAKEIAKKIISKTCS